ncbi:MAG: sortase [Clostridiales bacterium]|nr:sortase [Candidatus Scatonaster coprocaballi]
MKTPRKTIGNILLCIGLLLLLAGGIWYAHNLHESNRAYELGVEEVAKVKEFVAKRREELSTSQPEITVEGGTSVHAPVKQLPVFVIDDYPYCGYLYIPDIELEMAVVDEATEQNMKYSLCRYAGDPFQQNMVIAGHNYRSVFRKLRDLEAGDDIYFTDMDGEVFHYTVLESVVIPGKGVEEMLEGEWDLTLFTCTYGGADRYTIRCVEVDD